MVPFDAPSLCGDSLDYNTQCWHEAWDAYDYYNRYYDIVYSGWDFFYTNEYYKVTSRESRGMFMDSE